MVQYERLHVAFYSTLGGREPVREWMGKLDESSEKAVRETIETVRLGWPIGMPAARSLGHGLWELRARTPRGQARVIFCFSGKVMLLLHGFIKKSAKTPRRQLELARRRSREVAQRGKQ